MTELKEIKEIAKNLINILESLAESDQTCAFIRDNNPDFKKLKELVE